jgi:hypothetical protein
MIEVSHVVWCGAPLEMMGESKCSAQRACSLRPRCIKAVGPWIHVSIYLPQMKPEWTEFFGIILWSHVITIPHLTPERLKRGNSSYVILYLTGKIRHIMNGLEDCNNMYINFVMCVLFFWYWSCFCMMCYKEVCYATDILEMIAVFIFKGKWGQYAFMVNWLVFVGCLVWILAARLSIMIEGFCGFLQSQTTSGNAF